MSSTYDVFGLMVHEFRRALLLVWLCLSVVCRQDLEVLSLMDVQSSVLRFVRSKHCCLGSFLLMEWWVALAGELDGLSICFREPEGSGESDGIRIELPSPGKELAMHVLCRSSHREVRLF